MGVLIKINDATFKKYIGTAEITDEPITPDVPDIPDAPVCEHEYDNDYDTTCNICGAVREVVIPDTYPATDTLKGLYYLGGDQEATLANHADGGSDAGLTGSLAYADGYATFTGDYNDSRIDTNIITSAENKTTVVALFRVREGVRYIVSNLASVKSACFTNTAATHFTDAIKSVSYDEWLHTEDFVLCVFTVDKDGCSAMQDVNGVQTELLNKAAKFEADCLAGGFTTPWVIGGSAKNVSYNATADIAMVSIHEGEVTDEQLTQILAHVRWYAESKGLTVE